MNERELRYIAWAVLAVIASLCANEFVIKPMEAAGAEVRPDDIFLVSYPKSGNTWLRVIMMHLYNWHQMHRDGEHATELVNLQNIEESIPDLEYGPNRRDYSQFPEPRMFKSHQPFAPEAVQGSCDATVGTMDNYQCACPNCPPNWRRMVYMYRDGRDVMCSYYHFQTELGIVPVGTSFEDFLEKPLYPGYDWASHVMSYIDLQENPQYDIHFVRYEDLLSDPVATVSKLAAWAGLPSGPAAVEWAVAQSDFVNMQKMEARHGLKLFDKEYSKDTRAEEFRLIRKGQVGGWRDDPACSGELGELGKAVLKKLGYR